MPPVGGMILDYTSNAPLDGASITATGVPGVVTSGTSGNFILPVPASTPGQTIQIRVDMKGYDSWTDQLPLPSSENEIQLHPETENAQTPKTQIPDGGWSGNMSEIDTTIGGGGTCIYAVSFKNLATSFTIKDGEVENAILAYIYNDAAPNCSSPSGIPDTKNQFAMAAFTVSHSTLHIEFIQKSGRPAATAKLDAVLDESSSMKGRLTITRIDLAGNLNWNVVQSIPLSR
jgi:hypothetical protein